MWPGVVYRWGSTPEERAQRWPCDPLVRDPDEVLFRAVDVRAPAATMFRWLCQLRSAPYSYDLLDNAGRRSPQTLTPGLERLERGQRVMTIFRLMEFEEGRSITVLSRTRLFGRVACTYRVTSAAGGRSRLAVKLLVAYTRVGALRSPLSLILPPGDLLMMRRQLLNLATLAEAQGAA